jgi:fimbrial chaperone protein
MSLDVRQPLSAGAVRAARSVLLALAALLAAAPGPTLAGEYSVSPLRIDLDRDARSGVVTLTNSGTAPIDFQVSVLEWTQDAGGQDRYAPTGDVVFFPRILTVAPGESRVVRVGIQSPPAMVERAYRLFIEPIPERSGEPLPPGVNIAVNLRFALPVFARPPKPEVAAEIDGSAIHAGKLTFSLRNGGNVHLRFDEGVTVVGRDAQGGEVFTRRVDARYVLAGASRPLTLDIPRELCRRVAALELTAQAERLTTSRRLAVSRANCE